MNKNSGVAIITLVIILVIIGFFTTIGIKYTKEYFDKQKDEDIKALMFSIQRVITNIKNRHTIDEENPLIGIELNIENNETEYILTDKLKEQLLTLEDPVLYIVTR